MKSLSWAICPTPHPNCQMCPESNPFSPLPRFDYGPSHHPSPLNDGSSRLTGFPASTRVLTWNLHSAKNESFRSPIFNFFTQNSPMAGETLRMRFLLLWPSPLLSHPLQPHLLPRWSSGWQTHSCRMLFTGHCFSLEHPPTQIFTWLIPSPPSKLCSKVTFS